MPQDLIQPPPVTEPIATAHNLVVKFGRFTALNHVNVELPPGSIGLLGPNGAGKSTFLKTLMGFLKPDEGSTTVLGMDVALQPRAVRQQLGIMPEQDCHIPGMPAIEFVAFCGQLSGLPAGQAIRRAHEVLEYCGLGEARYRNIETYSTGMKQRIKLAQALVHGPKLLLLDEPTNGLDPEGRNDMLDLIRRISREGLVNVILSSHLLKDVERTCDWIMVIFQGQVRATGMLKDLTRIEGRPVRVELRHENPGFVQALSSGGLNILRSGATSVDIQVDLPPEEVSKRVFQIATQSGAQVRGIEPLSRSLEETFLQVIQ